MDTSNIYRYKKGNKWYEFDKSILSPTDLQLFERANWQDKLKIITVYKSLKPTEKVTSVELSTRKENPIKELRQSTYNKRKQAIDDGITMQTQQIEQINADPLKSQAVKDKEIKKAEEKIKEYLKQLDSLNIEYSDIINIKSANEVGITNAQNVTISNASKLITNIQDINTNINKLSRSLSEDDINIIKDTVARMIADNASTSREIEGLQTMINQLKETVRGYDENTTQEIEGLHELINDLKESVKNTGKQTVDELRTKINEIKTALNKLTPELSPDDITFIRESLTRITVNNESAAQEIEGLQTMINDLKDSVNSSDRKTLNQLLRQVQSLQEFTNSNPEALERVKTLSSVVLPNDRTEQDEPTITPTTITELITKFTPTGFNDMINTLTKDEIEQVKATQPEPIKALILLTTLKQLYNQLQNWAGHSIQVGGENKKVTAVAISTRFITKEPKYNEGAAFFIRSTAFEQLPQLVKEYMTNKLTNYNGKVYIYCTASQSPIKFYREDYKEFIIDSTGVDLPQILNMVIPVAGSLKSRIVKSLDSSIERRFKQLIEQTIDSKLKDISNKLDVLITRLNDVTEEVKQVKSEKVLRHKDITNVNESLAKARPETKPVRQMIKLEDIKLKHVEPNERVIQEEDPDDITTQLKRKMEDRRKDIAPEEYAEGYDEDDDEWADGFREALKLMNYLKSSKAKNKAVGYNDIKRMYNELYD